MVSITGNQIIAADFHPGAGETFAAVNPDLGTDLEPQFREATRDEVALAVGAAAAGFDLYRKLSPSQRAAFLECIAEQLIKFGPELIDRAQQETALPKLRLEGELARTVNQVKLFAQQVRERPCGAVRIDRAMPERAPVPKPDLRTRHVPLGPVAVFGASNFPLAFSVAGGDTVSALAAGCPVVVKGHPAHPGTSELAGQAIMRAVEKSRVPAGTFSLLQGKSHEVGAALVKHPLIKAVAFTGSLAGGRALFDLAAARSEPVPVYAEMGSANPVFFLPEVIAAQGDSLAEALTESITLGVGQFCTAPGLILVVRDAATNKFIAQLEKLLAAKAPAVMLHKNIKDNFRTDLTRLTSVGGVEQCVAPSTLNGCQVTPVLLKTDAKTLLANPFLAEEVFGPVGLVTFCDSIEEMLLAAESLPGQLTATVHAAGDDLATCAELFCILERKAGRLIMNGFPTGVEVCAAMNHGGPYPATTDSRSTSVGIDAMKRFLRPVCYQNFPQELLPESLRDLNLGKP